MAGNFFTTICKTLTLMFSLVIVYFLLIQQDEEFYLQNVLNLIVPLLVIFYLILGDSFRKQLNMQPFYEHHRPCWRYNRIHVHSWHWDLKERLWWDRTFQLSPQCQAYYSGSLKPMRSLFNLISYFYLSFSYLLILF